MTPKERLLDSAGTNYNTDSSNQVVHVLVRLSDLRLVMDVVKAAESQSKRNRPELAAALAGLNKSESYNSYRSNTYECPDTGVSLYRTDVV